MAIARLSFGFAFVALAFVSATLSTGPVAAGEPEHAKLDASSGGPPPSEPGGYRMDDYRKPVPATLAGAQVITTEQAEKIWEKKSAIFVDVFPKPHKPDNLPAGTLWIDPKHDTIEGAHWVPNVGYGALPSELETYFKAQLKKLTEANPDKPLLFFCLRDCWMSWNAGKRALEWGYKSVIWFPEGTDGWQEAGNDLTSVASEP